MSQEFDTPTQEPENQIRWTIHDTNPELVDTMRARLSEVIDPELGYDIVQLGLVRDFSVENGIGKLKMILTTPFCPYGPEMVAMTKIKAEVGLETTVEIEMMPEVWDPSMAEDPEIFSWGM
jgi:metal-sulfur cluster biosynthetic enzyme